ncbi:MAG: hypothetical protein P4N59_07450 [Negativicutes bacterium]|nr:hypothetical protein [Negativicutes bacterium]
MVKIRGYKPGDMRHIAANIRPIDAKEAWCLTGKEPLEAIAESIQRSDTIRIAEYNGEPVAIFGIGRKDLLSGEGIIWLVGTTNFKLMRKTFLQISKETISFLLTFYPVAVNYVLAENKGTIKWLKWCGAEIGDSEPYGTGREMFRKLTLRRDA